MSTTDKSKLLALAELVDNLKVPVLSDTDAAADASWRCCDAIEKCLEEIRNAAETL